MTDSDDPACLAALTTQLGHAPPFTADELAGVKSLTITHARDLGAIAGCVGLEHLRIVASELEDLLALEALQSVKHLEIHSTQLSSIVGLRARKLVRIDVMFCSMDDGSTFLGAHDWQGTLVGNPWEATSRLALTEQLENGHILVDVGSQRDWEECCLLWERLGACSGEVAGDYGLLVRPGLPTLTKNTYDAIHVPTGVARSELRDPDMTLEKLFAKYAHQVEAPDLAELAATRILGRTKQAQQWIADSALAAADKAALDSFVTRFPKIVFYRATKAAIERTEKVFELKLPDGYRAQREAIDGWWPQGLCPPVRFDRFEETSPRGDAVATYTYNLGLRDHGDDQRDAMLKAGFIIVGWSKERPQSTLAIRLDGDPAVYEYSPADMLDAMSEGRDVTTSIYPVFRSYAAMLGHIVSIHLPDDVVSARTS